MATPETKFIWCPATDKLTQLNWKKWKRTVIQIVTQRELLGHLDGTTLLPPLIYAPPAVPGNPAILDAGSVAAQRVWKLNENLVQSLLTMNIEDVEDHGIDVDGSAHLIWVGLILRYERADRMTKMSTMDLLREKQYDDYSDLSMHFAELQRRRSAAIMAGNVIDDNAWLTIIIKSMPASWDSVMMALMKETSVSAAMATMLAWSVHLADKAKTRTVNSSSKPTAYWVNGRTNPSVGKMCDNCKKIIQRQRSRGHT
jgi:hypothetical protein